MPVVGGADDDRVDVLAVQHLPEVAGDQVGVLAVLPGHPGAGFRALLFVHVAQGHALDPVDFQEVPQVGLPHSSAPDQPDPDTVVRALDVPAAACGSTAASLQDGEACRGCTQPRGLPQKIPTIPSLHIRLLLFSRDPLSANVPRTCNRNRAVDIAPGCSARLANSRPYEPVRNEIPFVSAFLPRRLGRGKRSGQRRTVCLRTDSSLLPMRRVSRAWWNYLLNLAGSSAATLTSNMDRLQSLKSPKDRCLTLKTTLRSVLHGLCTAWCTIIACVRARRFGRAGRSSRAQTGRTSAARTGSTVVDRDAHPSRVLERAGGQDAATAPQSMTLS